jgi:dTDP-4-amino-4,6-dideoxy-D-galactose acyltransferase
MSTSDLCAILDWDTAFFGMQIARVRQDTLTAGEAQAIDAWCRTKAVECLYFLARSDEPSVLRVAQMYGFDLVDIRVTCLRELPADASIGDSSSQVIVRPAEPADVAFLRKIARSSHTDTRFYADEHFPRHLCAALYDTWILRSCTGYADTVFVAEAEAAPAGYISCHLDAASSAGSIGLVGVDKLAQGMGVGQALVRRALDWFATQKTRTVSVVTQGRNIAAQRLYQKNGFLTTSIQIWYHKWYARSEDRHS